MGHGGQVHEASPRSGHRRQAGVAERFFGIYLMAEILSNGIPALRLADGKSGSVIGTSRRGGNGGWRNGGSAPVEPERTNQFVNLLQYSRIYAFVE
jgi:hypothetical protein